MDINTGKIHLFTEEEYIAAEKDGARLVEITELAMTEKQRTHMYVNSHDTSSILGRKLRAERSKYSPHFGAKQLAKKFAKETHAQSVA